jgi:hypothetical protein
MYDVIVTQQSSFAAVASLEVQSNTIILSTGFHSILPGTFDHIKLQCLLGDGLVGVLVTDIH